MAVTKIKGTNSVITIGGVAVECVKSAELTIDQDEVETTDNDSSNGWKEFLMGNRSGSFKYTCNFDALLGATQQIMFSGISAGTPTTYTFVFYPNGTGATNRKYTFTGYIKSAAHPTTNNQVVEVTADVRITGSIAVATV